ncbi:hypothetical protein [Halorussus caseinilyticus]|uniref:hypothetical protein n=1 Tax=Halorussus caseinilyticus TaxID=3034025 RepID=UPI0023E7A9D4|nr:hypothetical protein [Halorussus sp. DT72]
MKETKLKERRDTFESRGEEYQEAMKTIADYSRDDCNDCVSREEYEDALDTVKQYQRSNFHV